jgi:hypothetical protein
MKTIEHQYGISKHYVNQTFAFLNEVRKEMLRLMGVDPDGLAEWELERAVSVPEWVTVIDETFHEHYNFVCEYEFFQGLYCIEN